MSYNRERRRTRRQNHIAKDLRTPKYRKRVVERKPSYEPTVEDELHEMEDSFCPECGGIAAVVNGYCYTCEERRVRTEGY